MRIAVGTGVDGGSPGTACPPWIFPCDDSRDYYTKLVGRCREQAQFREAEFVTSRMGRLLGVPVPEASPVFVPAAIAASTGLGIPQQWGVGMLRISGTEEPQATFAGLVAAQTVERRVAMVALHSWLGVGDHSPGHNFFRDFVSNDLVSLDHASALGACFTGQPALPIGMVDPGQFLTGITPDDPARQVVADRIRGIQRPDLEAIMQDFPDDPANPWLDPAARTNLVQWILDRGGEVAHGIEH